MSDNGPCNCDQALELEALVKAVSEAWEAWHENDHQFVSEEIIEACWACVEYRKQKSTNPTEGD